MVLFCLVVVFVLKCPFVHALCISGFFCFFPVLVVYKVVFFYRSKKKGVSCFEQGVCSCLGIIGCWSW